MRELIVKFESRHGFPQAFGCVDGTHITIVQPLENSHDYFSYKMKYTLNVQGICDYQGRFIDVDCRWPGSVHDAKVFSNANINIITCYRRVNSRRSIEHFSLASTKAPVYCLETLPIHC